MVYKKKVKWNKKKEDKFYRSYKKKSRNIQMKKQRSAWKLEKKALKTYNIQAL